MKLRKEEKTRLVSELQGKFEKANGVIFTDYRGLTVEEITDFRNLLRTSLFEFRVVKNTLAKRAAEGTSLDNVKDLFSGPVGLAIGYDDPVLLAKRVFEYSKTNEKLRITGGAVEGEACDLNKLKALSELPPREVLLSMIASAMQSPLYKLASAFNATLLQVLHAMEALKRKRES